MRSFLCYMLTLAIIGFSLAPTADADTISVESCRAFGFDPYQLACSTCDILPPSVVEKCKSCCLSYKTLDKRTRRYQAAVVAHPKGSPSYFQEVANMIDEDWDGLIEQKGSKRLVLKDTSAEPRPSTLFWFDEIPPSLASMSIDALTKEASDIVVLDGWKRDDIREMLKAIIPDN